MRALLSNFHITKKINLEDRYKQDECTWNSKLLIGRYGEHNGKLWFFGSWMHEKYSLSVQMKARKRLGATKLREQ
jgi:hypothetical protein